MLNETGDVQNFLANHSVFSEMDSEQLELATHNISIAFGKSGAQLRFDITPSGKPVGMLIVRSGSLEIRNSSGDLVDRLSIGDYIITASLSADPNNLQVVSVLEDCLYYELSEHSFQSLLSNNPLLSSLCENTTRKIINGTPATLIDSLAGRDNILGDINLVRQVKDYMSTSLVCVERGVSIRQAAVLMHERRVSSLLIKSQGKVVGILTDRDFRNRVLAKQRDASDTVDAVMTQSLTCIEAHTLLHEAQLIMMQKDVHHLPVLKDNKPIGMLTVSDILRANNIEPLSLNKGINGATCIEDVADVAKKIPELVAKLIERDTRAVEVGEIITSLSDAITKKLLKLGIKKFGEAPCQYAWIAFGSQARQEQVLGSDQDNGIILSDIVKEEDLGYFEKLTHFVTDGLDVCGMPYCPGEIMASNKKWRMPLENWKQRFSNWIEERSPEDLMYASIFFDMRHIAGTEQLSLGLHEYMLDKAKANTIFTALMCTNALQRKPPLGFFKTFVLESAGEHNNSLDLKSRGTIPIVDIARNYSLAAGLPQLNTIQRLNALLETGAMSESMARSLIDAHEFIAGIRLAAQGREFKAQQKIDNYLDPRDLSPLVRHQLKEAFSLVREAQSAMNVRLAAGAL